MVAVHLPLKILIIVLSIGKTIINDLKYHSRFSLCMIVYASAPITHPCNSSFPIVGMYFEKNKVKTKII